MKALYRGGAGIAVCLLAIGGLGSPALARVPYPVAASYEDTVRVVVLWNTPLGRDCLGNPPPVGEETRDYIMASIDTTFVHNVKVLKTWDCVPADENYPSTCTTAPDTTTIKNLWPGRLPHVIVHVNAGWSGWNGPNLTSILTWATRNYVGIVEIGDDGAGISSDIFGLGLVNGWPMQMQTATWLDQTADSLMLKVHPELDDFVDSTVYPFLTGVIINATQKLLRGSTFYFEPYAAGGRCEADADDWDLAPNFRSRVTFLGYQQGWNNQGPDNLPYGGDAVPQGYVGAADEWSILAVLQDSIKIGGEVVIRRGVAVSLQPQYLASTVASQQLVYDAIMFASLAHTLRPKAVQISVSSDTIIAGQVATLTAAILPADLPADVRQSLAQSVSWSLDPVFARRGDSLTGTVGPASQVTGTEAFRSIHVIATLYDAAFQQTVYDTALIYVKPGPDYKVWIERTSATALASEAQVLPTTHADSVAPRPIDLITLDSSQTVAYAYAVVRDIYGNIKRVASFATWLDFQPPGPISAAATSGKQWEGTITRSTGTGTDSVRAWEGMPAVLIGDTVQVVIQAGTLMALKIVNENGDTLTNVTINTDQTQYFRVIGRWSDNPNTWVDFPAQWSMNPTIPSANAMPATDATNWTFSPTAPGGPSVLTAQNASGTRSVTVNITASPAPPSRVEITVLTAEPRAGTPFQAQVRIYNTDGLVPGLWCYPGNGTGQVVYQDVLYKSGQYPYVSTDYGFDTLNQRQGSGPLDTIHKVSECFNGGYDTVSLTLFYAPLSVDSNHVIWVGMHGASAYIEGSTEPFHLLPGPVDSIYLTDGNGVPLPDAATLAAPAGILYAKSIGVDAWGNSIGPVSASWSGSGNLHPPSPGPSMGQYYTTGTVTVAENGCIVATNATGSGDPTARDSICLTIAAPPAYVNVAFTRDNSGNGLLDRIEVHFSKLVAIPDTLPLSNIVVNYHSRTADYPLTVGDVIGNNGTTTDSVFYIELTESITTLPQTGWVPTIQFSGVQDVLTTVVTCTDGAGPVIWKVTKHVELVDDPSKDIVTVTFSEDLDKTPGATDDPGNVFFVWVKNGDGTFTSVDTLLNGIDYFLISQDQNQARFQMINGKNLTETNWLSIRVMPNVTPPVIDNSVLGNAPRENNQKVQVQIENPKMIVKAAPNPMVPNRFQPNDDLLKYNDPAVIARRAYEQGGTAFMVSVPLPSDKNMTLEGELMVYDLAGNLVHYRPSNGNIVPDSWRTNWQGGTTQRFGVYWNGLNDQGMKVMPGVYRGLVKLTARYTDSSTGQQKTERLHQVVGIGVRR